MTRKEFIKNTLLSFGAITVPVSVLANDDASNTYRNQFLDEANRIVSWQLQTKDYFIKKFEDGTTKKYYSVDPIGFFNFTGKSGKELHLVYELAASERRIYVDEGRIPTDKDKNCLIEKIASKLCATVYRSMPQELQ